VDIAQICERFNLGVQTGPLLYVARGELGRVSRLPTTAGLWAVKEIEFFVPTAAEADENLALQESMLHAGVRLPRPRRTVDGHALFDNVRVYEWLDMTPVPPGNVQVEGLVAKELARMHLQAPSTDRTPDRWYSEAPSRDDWDDLIDEGADLWWAKIVAALIAGLADLPRPVHSPPRICHLDVCPENVFWSDGRLTVIDWENAGPAATAQDLGSTLWDFCQGDIRRTRAFVDQYRRHGGPLERLDASLFDTAMVVQANLVDFHCRRALDRAGTDGTQQRAEESLRRLLARPLTRRLIDDIVAGRR
jgi:Ser/Thr protein kinase RdoA (MazF antagonist)